jgi:hypothetical protein
LRIILLSQKIRENNRNVVGKFNKTEKNNTGGFGERDKQPEGMKKVN